MRYKSAFVFWSFASPISWIIFLAGIGLAKGVSIPVAIFMGLIAVCSMVISLMAGFTFSESRHFFKKIDELESEIGKTRETRLMYTRLIESLNNVGNKP